jgi:pullulanase
MYESFGAVVTGNTVEFRLFLPDAARDPSQYSRGGSPRIKKVQVRGDFQSHIGSVNWGLASAPELTPQDHPKGVLYTFRIDHLPDGFYQYKYWITYENGTTRWCGDPCTRYVGPSNENAAFVVGGNDLTVRPLASPLSFQDLVIYELMIDDFTAGYRGDKAPVDAVLDKLDHLVNLGVNAVEFMPWTAWRGGAFSWGYDPYLFFSVENRYIDDPAEPLDRLYRLKRLMDALHQRGLHVLMDGVFNQLSKGAEPGTGFPYYWLYQNPDDSPYIGGFAGAGYDDEIEYYNGCTQEFITDLCKFWLDEYQLDGIRFDYSLGYYIPGDTTQGIPQLVSDLRAHVAGQGRSKVVFILEHLTDDRYAAVDATNTICATGCWFDRFLYDVPGYAAGEHVDTKVMRVLDTPRDFAAGKGPVPYVDNHDHSTVVNRVGGRGVWWKAQTPLLALLTVPGAVLLRNGQEFGEDDYVPDGGDNRVVPRPLHWELLQDGTGQWLYKLHQQLIALRKECPSLRSGNFYPGDYDERWGHFNDQGYGVDVDRGLVIYHRWWQEAGGAYERFIVVLNFSGSDQWADVPFSVNGAWTDRLNGDVLQVQNYRAPNLRIPSHWGRLFCNRS